MRRTLLWMLALAALLLGEARAEDPAPPPPAPREHLTQILDRPLYARWQRRQAPPERQRSALMESLRELRKEWAKRLSKALERFFAWLMPRSEKSGNFEMPNLPFGKIMLWLGIAAGAVVVAATAWLGYRAFRERRRGVHTARVLGREQVRRALENADATAMDASSWLAAADSFAHEGDFRALYRALYLALLAGLHDANRIDFRRSRTNWTYVRAFRGTEEERRLFGGLTEVFDRVWYGLVPAEPALVTETRRQVVRLLSREARDA